MIIRNLIYILQAELYDARKFLRFAYSHFQWWQLEKRAKLVWTKKALLVYALTVGMLLTILAIFLVFFGTLGMLSVVVLVPFVPVFIVFALWIIEPVDRFLKDRLFRKAQKFLRDNRKNLIVIGITGSYGKTTTREILASILSEKFRVIKLSENINTDAGVTDFILKNQKKFLEKTEHQLKNSRKNTIIHIEKIFQKPRMQRFKIDHLILIQWEKFIVRHTQNLCYISIF